MSSAACDRPGAAVPGCDSADAWRQALRDLAPRVLAEHPIPAAGPWIAPPVAWAALALRSAWQAIEAGTAPAERPILPALEVSFARELAAERERLDAGERA
ncbi:MAG: hypothetical protein ACK4PG_08625 [Acetobacteraceae bacterium]